MRVVFVHSSRLAVVCDCSRPYRQWPMQKILLAGEWGPGAVPHGMRWAGIAPPAEESQLF